MNNWSIGYALIWGRRFYGVFITLIALYFAWCLTLRKPERVCAQTIIIDSMGRVQMINCDPNSPLQRPVVEKVMTDVITGIYGYKKEGFLGYAQNYKTLSMYLEPYSAAAEVIAKEFAINVGEGEGGPVKHESSSFTPIPESFQFTQVPSENRWDVYFEGIRKLEQVQGVVEKKYKIKATIVEGDYRAIYKIRWIDPVDTGPAGR